MSDKHGALLVNLGSPDAPRTREVRRYLREFLSDPLVIDMNPVGRALLLYLIILPFRSPRSAEAYRKIWTEEGSPLLVHSRALTQAVKERLEPDVPVELAMRYGRPSIAEGLRRLRERGAGRVVTLPLYPQYAASSTQTVLDEVERVASGDWDGGDLTAVPPFYDHPGFIDAFAKVGGPALKAFAPDHVLMSYHGLPESHILKGDDTGAHCLQSEGCCNTIVAANRNCYRAHCMATSAALAKRLSLPPESYSVSFQSRLGRTPWIRPHTDVLLSELPQRGTKRVAVLCPSFVADCLETLEEIGIRGRRQFLDSGGEELLLVPSLNSHPAWVDTVVNLLQTAIHQGDGS